MAISINFLNSESADVLVNRKGSDNELVSHKVYYKHQIFTT